MKHVLLIAILATAPLPALAKSSRPPNKRPSPSSEKNEALAPPAPRRPPVDEAQLANVVSENKAAMKLCYLRGMRQDPTLKNAKIVTRLRIGSDGQVTEVSFGESVSGREDLGECLAQAIRQWEFPQAPSAYEYQFPILLMRN